MTDKDTQLLAEAYERTIIEAVNPKLITKLEFVMGKYGNRHAAIKLVDAVLSNRIELKSSDLGDTTIFANGLDEIEQYLADKDYEHAVQAAKDIAEDMIKDEFGNMPFDK